MTENFDRSETMINRHIGTRIMWKRPCNYRSRHVTFMINVLKEPRKVIDLNHTFYKTRVLIKIFLKFSKNGNVTSTKISSYKRKKLSLKSCNTYNGL